jgi:hypothetical protein
LLDFDHDQFAIVREPLINPLQGIGRARQLCGFSAGRSTFGGRCWSIALEETGAGLRLPQADSPARLRFALAFKAFAKEIPCFTPFLATSDPAELKRI